MMMSCDIHIVRGVQDVILLNKRPARHLHTILASVLVYGDLRVRMLS